MQIEMLMPVSLALMAASIEIILFHELSSCSQFLQASWQISWRLENFFMEAAINGILVLDRADISPGMKVLDIGSSSGRLSISAAGRVGKCGQVTVVGIQPALIPSLIKRAEDYEFESIKTLLGISRQGIVGQGMLERESFDRALAVAVLGETTDRTAAMREIYQALRPGGMLSVTEFMLDPHYQSFCTVLHIAKAAGFRLHSRYRGYLIFTANFVKPSQSEKQHEDRAAGEPSLSD